MGLYNVYNIQYLYRLIHSYFHNIVRYSEALETYLGLHVYNINLCHIIQIYDHVYTYIYTTSLHYFMTFRIQKTAVRSTEEVGRGFPHDPAAGTPGDPEFRSSRGSWVAGDVVAGDATHGTDGKHTIPTRDPSGNLLHPLVVI